MPRKNTTPQQRRQRELAWALYVTEGATANLYHALAVNCVTFEPADKVALQRAIDAQERACVHLRRRLSQI